MVVAGEEVEEVVEVGRRLGGGEVVEEGEGGHVGRRQGCWQGSSLL